MTHPDKECWRHNVLGVEHINATGNSSNNIINGNSGKNLLSGGDGNDTIIGGAGADTMVGGTGNDLYYVNSEDDVACRVGWNHQ